MLRASAFASNGLNGSQVSELIIADVRAGAPKLVARVPVDGSIAESRLVGSVLYLATNVNRTATDTTPAEYGLQLTSFDLADPTAPVLRGSIFLGGWANAVSATDRSSNAAAAASPPRALARPADCSRASAMSSSGPGLPRARCHARRSGSTSGSVASANALCAACRSASAVDPYTADRISG